MKTAFLVVVLVLSSSAMTAAASKKLTAGPDVTVKYDSLEWEPFASGPERGPLSTTMWKLKADERVQIGVTSREERLDEAAYKTKRQQSRRFLGDPPKLVGERRESLAGREWLITEYRHLDSDIETHYFLPTEDGHVTLYVTVPEEGFSKYREAIDELLETIHVK